MENTYTIPDDENTVTITLDHFGELLNDSRLLRALIDSGVDNWQWYDEAIALYQERLEEVCS